VRYIHYLVCRQKEAPAEFFSITLGALHHGAQACAARDSKRFSDSDFAVYVVSVLWTWFESADGMGNLALALDVRTTLFGSGGTPETLRITPGQSFIDVFFSQVCHNLRFDEFLQVLIGMRWFHAVRSSHEQGATPIAMPPLPPMHAVELCEVDNYDDDEPPYLLSCIDWASALIILLSLVFLVVAARVLALYSFDSLYTLDSSSLTCLADSFSTVSNALSSMQFPLNDGGIRNTMTLPMF
jgi:hypothetical protein